MILIVNCVLIFIDFWLHRVLVVAHGIIVVACGLLSSCGTWLSSSSVCGLSCPVAS